VNAKVIFLIERYKLNTPAIASIIPMLENEVKLSEKSPIAVIKSVVSLINL